MITTTASSRTTSPPPKDEHRPLLTIEYDGVDTPEDEEPRDMLVVISGANVRFIPLREGELESVTACVTSLRGDA